jgi:hypothetical protein
MVFRVLWAIDALIALVFVYFFFVGLGDGSVSSFNGALWAGILFGLGAVLCGSYWLRAAGWTGAAMAIVLALAVPGILSGFLLLAVIFVHPSH